MAGISKKKRKLKSGKEKIFYTITYRDIFGKQHTHGCYATQSEAKAHLYEFQEVNPKVEEITFGQIFQAYLEFIKAKGSHTTYEIRELYCKLHFSKLYELKYQKISSLDLEKFIINIELNNSPAVAEMCHKIGKAAVNFAMKHKMVKENKFNDVTKVKVPKKPKCHLNEDQERYILKCCEEIYPKYHDLFCLIMGTGMREGEALALQKESIDFENKRLLVDKQFTKRKLRLIPKTNAGYRYVYLTDDVLEVLKNRIERLPNSTKLVFPNDINGYLDIGNIRRRIWKPLLVYADVKDPVGIHDLRGSYADIALAHGASIKFIQNQLGHAKSQTTLDVYAKISQDMINRALDSMNGFLKY